MIYATRSQPRSVADKPLSLRSSALEIRQALRASETEAARSDEPADQFDLELAKRIISRIESRLPGRVRHLTVYTTDHAVILTGECSTYYTKQLAQHNAMGVLEYEQLINNIDVRVAK